VPLFENAAKIIRANLEEIIALGRPRVVEIGALTTDQLAAINEFRIENDLPPIIAQVKFLGRHIYQSRIVGNGYMVDEIIEQIESAMQPCSVVKVSEVRTALENPNRRIDRYGNSVSDRAVLECTRRHPWPELFSVIPIGDVIRPK
jgi:hypothetical protein